MTAKSMALLFADLGIVKSHSRPHVSDDNPFSEAQFKTVKYHPGFPERFGSAEDARANCRPLLSWYNTEHHHSSLALLTPEDVHRGRGEQVLAQRDLVLTSAFNAHPERFVRRKPVAKRPPLAVWINPPAHAAEAIDDQLILEGAAL
jgi:putative transposase